MICQFHRHVGTCGDVAFLGDLDEGLAERAEMVAWCHFASSGFSFLLEFLVLRALGILVGGMGLF